jgi:hypothetical protein
MTSVPGFDPLILNYLGRRQVTITANLRKNADKCCALKHFRDEKQQYFAASTNLILSRSRRHQCSVSGTQPVLYNGRNSSLDADRASRKRSYCENRQSAQPHPAATLAITGVEDQRQSVFGPCRKKQTSSHYHSSGF